MKTEQQITDYLSSLPEPKKSEVKALHERIQKLLPEGKLWFADGKDETGKVVSNPSIGYGSYTIQYANGKSKEFYQVGISANTSGISVYIMGIENKKYLPDTYGNKIGKASVTGYCIKFKKLADIHSDVLDEAIQDGVKQTA